MLSQLSPYIPDSAHKFSKKLKGWIRSFDTALALLIVAAFLGNYFHISLFFGTDFVFGSVAVLAVLYLYGLRWGILAALVAHSYTYFLWGHPYMLLSIFSARLSSWVSFSGGAAEI